MEQILQYVWQHRLWRSDDMTTNDGHRLRVLDPGLLNTGAGPDFCNAKVEMDGRVWVGNVEIHVRATDWRRHGHDSDPAYDSVILHVVQHDDAPVHRTNGERIPQVVLDISPRFGESLDRLVQARTDLPCAAQLHMVPVLTVTEWMQALAFERLNAKVDRIAALREQYAGSWEDVCYVMLARTLGFGINSDALERLARRTPLRLLHKHSDSLLQLEALLLGQAGLLDGATDAGGHYVEQLRREYAFLANKFSLQPMEREAWKLFRIRPQNFPHRRIALLAHFVHDGFNLMHSLLEAQGEKELRQLFQVELTGYWQRHYTLGKEAPTSTRALTSASIDIVLINLVAPLYCAYGSLTGDHTMADRAIDLLESLRPEQNAIVATFVHAGLRCDDALTSQALIQLRKAYCDTRKCIYCRIGHRLLAEAARR